MSWCIVGNAHDAWSLFHQHFNSACQPPWKWLFDSRQCENPFEFVKVMWQGSHCLHCAVHLALSHDLLFALFIKFIQLRSINNHRLHRKPKRVLHVKDGHQGSFYQSYKTNVTYNNKTFIEECGNVFIIYRRLQNSSIYTNNCGFNITIYPYIWIYDFYFDYYA